VNLNSRRAFEWRKRMKKHSFSLARKIALLGLACLFVLNISAWIQDENLSPGINERFRKQPDLSIKQFDSFALDSVEQQKEILEACGIQPGMDIADIGAGSGVHALILQKKCPLEARSMPWTSYGSFWTILMRPAEKRE
jgi:hypothetical protein